MATARRPPRPTSPGIRKSDNGHSLRAAGREEAGATGGCDAWRPWRSAVRIDFGATIVGGHFALGNVPADLVCRRLDELGRSVAVITDATECPGRWRFVLRDRAVGKKARASGSKALEPMVTLPTSSDCYSSALENLLARPRLGEPGAKLRTSGCEANRLSIAVGNVTSPVPRYGERSRCCFLLTKPDMSSTRDQVSTPYGRKQIRGRVEFSEPGVLPPSCARGIRDYRRRLPPSRSDLIWLDGELVLAAVTTAELIKSFPVPTPDQSIWSSHQRALCARFQYEEWAAPRTGSASYLEIVERALSEDIETGTDRGSAWPGAY